MVADLKKINKKRYTHTHTHSPTPTPHPITILKQYLIFSTFLVLLCVALELVTDLACSANFMYLFSTQKYTNTIFCQKYDFPGTVLQKIRID